MKNVRIELRWALLFSITMMILGFVEKLLGWHETAIDKQMGRHFILLIFIYFLLFYLAIRDKKRNFYNDKITWKRGVLSGSIMTVFIALLSPLFVFFVYYYISPQYFEHMIAYQTQKENFPMTREGAESFFNMTSFVFLELSTVFSFGIGLSAIVSLLLRSKEN